MRKEEPEIRRGRSCREAMIWRKDENRDDGDERDVVCFCLALGEGTNKTDMTIDRAAIMK